MAGWRKIPQVLKHLSQVQVCTSLFSISFLPSSLSIPIEQLPSPDRLLPWFHYFSYLIQYIAIIVGFCSLAFLAIMNFLKTRLPERIEQYHEAPASMRAQRSVVNILLRVFHLTPPIVVVVIVGITITYSFDLAAKVYFVILFMHLHL